MKTQKMTTQIAVTNSSLILPTTSTNTRPLAIRFTQAFHCPLDGRVCSGNRRRLLGNEPVSHGDFRTQNGILRQVTFVVHCRSPPIAVEPHTPLLQDCLVRGEGRVWFPISSSTSIGPEFKPQPMDGRVVTSVGCGFRMCQCRGYSFRASRSYRIGCCSGLFGSVERHKSRGWWCRA